MSTTYAARVLELTDVGPLVRVPMLGGGQEWGPLASSVTDLEVGDQVIVSPLGEAADRLHVLARLEGRQTRQSEIVGLAARLDAIDARDSGQDVRLSGIDTLNGQQNSRLSSLESRADGSDTLNGQQNSRLSSIETVNTAQNNRLTATEGVANAAATQTALTALDGAALHKTGAESKSGVLTLTSEPVIPAATLDTSPVRRDDVRVARRLCRVEMAGSSAIGYSASSGDIWAQSGWQTSAANDRYGMATLSTTAGTLSYITAPVDGFYDVDYRQLWQTSTNTANTIACFVAVGSAAAGSTFARDARRYVPSGADGSPVQARERWPLTAGQKLYWGLYSDVNSSFLPVAGVSTLVRSRIIVSYYGPL